MKGKPWTKKEEHALVDLVRKKRVDVIVKALGKTEEAIYMKLKRLGLEVVVSGKNQPTTTTKAALPEELPTARPLEGTKMGMITAFQMDTTKPKSLVFLEPHSACYYVCKLHRHCKRPRNS